MNPITTNSTWNVQLLVVRYGLSRAPLWTIKCWNKRHFVFSYSLDPSRDRVLLDTKCDSENIIALRRIEDDWQTNKMRCIRGGLELNVNSMLYEDQAQ